MQSDGQQSSRIAKSATEAGYKNGSWYLAEYADVDERLLGGLLLLRGAVALLLLQLGLLLGRLRLRLQLLLPARHLRTADRSLRRGPSGHVTMTR